MNFAISEMNALAVLVAALLYFFIGTVWYSPVLICETWIAELGRKREDLSRNPFLYILTFIMSVVGAFALACVFQISGLDGLVPGLFAGLMLGLALTAAGAIVQTLQNDYRQYKLFLIHAGYHMVSFTVMGALLGVWR